MSKKNYDVVNSAISSASVTVIDQDGKNLGVMPIDAALQTAQSQQLDLVLGSASHSHRASPSSQHVAVSLVGRWKRLHRSLQPVMVDRRRRRLRWRLGVAAEVAHRRGADWWR